MRDFPLSEFRKQGERHALLVFDMFVTFSFMVVDCPGGDGVSQFTLARSRQSEHEFTIDRDTYSAAFSRMHFARY